MSKQIPLKINGFAETRDSPHLPTCLKTFPGYLGQAPPAWVKEEVIQCFPVKTNISIPLSDWSRDSVAPTHKYCGKLEFR